MIVDYMVKETGIRKRVKASLGFPRFLALPTRENGMAFTV